MTVLNFGFLVLGYALCLFQVLYLTRKRPGE